MKRPVAERLGEQDLAYLKNHRSSITPEFSDAELLEAPHLTNPTVVGSGHVGGAIPQPITYWWGKETPILNHDRYSIRELTIQKNGHTSMHFHVERHKTIYVARGVLTLELQVDAEISIYKVEAGNAWEIPPGCPHRMSSIDGEVVVVEASTFDEDKPINLY